MWYTLLTIEANKEIMTHNLGVAFPPILKKASHSTA